MMVMYSNSKAIDPVIIADALAKDGKYDEAGGRDYLCSLHNLFRQPQMLYIMLKS